MKILKIFGIVVGIHVFALVLIFANPGCSTSTKPPPIPGDTIAQSAPPAVVTLPNTPAGVYTSAPAPVTAAPIAFDPNAPAVAAAGSSATTVRFVPTRPGTPVAGTLVTEKVADVTPTSTYVVKSGDSLWSIAKKHKLTVADLTVANGIAANANLQPGKKLLLPANSNPAAVAATAAATGTAAKSAEPAPAARVTGEGVKHTVKSGETLGTIARNYGVRQSEIAVANHISDPAKIQAGMELVIPGWQPTGCKTGKGAGKTAPAVSPKVEPKVEEPAAAVPPPPVVPIIRIDDSPVTPAPKR
jgi:LysM repeat protein